MNMTITHHKRPLTEPEQISSHILDIVSELRMIAESAQSRATFRNSSKAQANQTATYIKAHVPLITTSIDQSQRFGNQLTQPVRDFLFSDARSAVFEMKKHIDTLSTTYPIPSQLHEEAAQGILRLCKRAMHRVASFNDPMITGEYKGFIAEQARLTQTL